MGIAEDIVIIVVAGLLTGFAAHKLKLPLLLGYILAGIVIGPYTGGITVSNVHQVELIAEIGVALLLFSIGLDLSLDGIREVFRVSVIGTLIQVLLTGIYGYVIASLLAFSWTESVIFGAILSLSSTMVVVKTLMGRGLMGTLSSRVMLGMLIVQDLIAVPMMIIIPQLRGVSENINSVVLIFAKGAGLLALVIILAVKLVPRILKYIALMNSRELFLLTIAALSLGIGFITYAIGFSFALGAFVAGIILSKTEFNHRALNDIIPIRDLFGLIFFTSVGMLLDPFFLAENIKIIFLIVALSIAGKFLIFLIITRSFGYYNIIPIAAGLGMAQIGEFSFVLARLGINNGLMRKEIFMIVLSASVVTMFATPFLTMLSVPVYSLKNRLFKKENVVLGNIPDEGLKKHVIVVGGGRVGQNIARLLFSIGMPFIIIEEDYSRFESFKKEGFSVIYGDAGQEQILEAASIPDCRLLVVTVPAFSVAREIIVIAEKHNPGLKIIARCSNLEQAAELEGLGVKDIVQPEFEASLELVRQSLLYLEVPVSAIQKYVDDIRKEKFSLAHSAGYKALSDIKNASQLMDINWYQVHDSSPASGKSVAQMNIRSKTGVTVIGVLREGEFIPNPDSGFIFNNGDMITVIGKYENKKLFEDMIGPDKADS